MSGIKNILGESVNSTHIISIGLFAKAAPEEKTGAVLERESRTIIYWKLN
jgi:hypothetical protein